MFLLLRLKTTHCSVYVCACPFMLILYTFVRVFLIYIIPLLAAMVLPFAHLGWKGQPCSNIDTIDMFAETGERDRRQVDKQRFMNQVYSVSEGRQF